MSENSKSEIEGLILAITRLSAAGKSAQEIQTYFECEQLLGDTETLEPKPTKRRRRKKLKDAILKFLSSQGKKGAHVKVIAERVGSKPANVTAWIFSTGKKVVGLKKVKPATYVYFPKAEPRLKR